MQSGLGIYLGPCKELKWAPKRIEIVSNYCVSLLFVNKLLCSITHLKIIPLVTLVGLLSLKSFKKIRWKIKGFIPAWRVSGFRCGSDPSDASHIRGNNAWPILYSCPPKGRWIVVDTCWVASQYISSARHTNPEGNSCFSTYRIYSTIRRAIFAPN